MDITIFAHTAPNSAFRVGSHHLHEEFQKMGFGSHYYSYNGSENKFSFLCFFKLFFLLLWSLFQRGESVNLLDSPFYFCFLPLIKGMKVYRVTDNYGARSRCIRFIEFLFFKNFPVITTNHILSKIYIERGFNVIGTVVNGVPEYILKEGVKLKIDPITTKGSLKFFYVGAFDKRFEASYIFRLVKDFPNCEVHLVGSGRKCLNLQGNQQIHLYGEKDFNNWKVIAKNCDFGLMPFGKDIQNLTRSPMKKYEYFALGLPVIVWDIFDEVGLIHYSALLEKRNNLEFFENQYSSELLVELAGKNGWKSKALNYLNLLEGYVDDLDCK